MSASTSQPQPQGTWRLTDMPKALQTWKQDPTHMPEVRIQGICTDSRQLHPGNLFIALRGETFDGHTFAREAAALGACALVVDKQGYAQIGQLPIPVLVVQDTLHALGALAAWHRARIHHPVVAVTGSNGKTTTKELLAAALGQRGAVHKTFGNLNNLVGVPLTLLNWDSQHTWAAVIEMGMNAPGEIARLTEIAQPQVGLITCVAPAHLEGLGSLEKIAEAKLELFAQMPSGSHAILNADDPMLTAHSAQYLGDKKVLRFGRASDCDVCVRAVAQHAAHLTFELVFEQRHVHRVRLPLLGQHNAYNAAAAAAAATALGMAPADIVQGLQHVQVPGARLRMLHDVGIGIHVMDDTYNANPASVQAALRTLTDLGRGHRCLAVLGDMLELGPQTAELHRQVGAFAAKIGIQKLFALGRFAEATIEGFVQAGGQGGAFTEYPKLLDSVEKTLQPDDWLLIKGSRGMRMERLVSEVTKGGA